MIMLLKVKTDLKQEVENKLFGSYFQEQSFVLKNMENTINLFGSHFSCSQNPYFQRTPISEFSKTIF